MEGHQAGQEGVMSSDGNKSTFASEKNREGMFLMDS